jgi:hypothetical protein
VFSSATILGCQCSENRANFSAMFILSIFSPLARGIQNIILQKLHERDAVSELRPMCGRALRLRPVVSPLVVHALKPSCPPYDNLLKLCETIGQSGGTGLQDQG